MGLQEFQERMSSSIKYQDLILSGFLFLMEREFYEIVGCCAVVNLAVQKQWYGEHEDRIT